MLFWVGSGVYDWRVGFGMGMGMVLEGEMGSVHVVQIGMHRILGVK